MLITRTSMLTGKVATLDLPVTVEQLAEYETGAFLQDVFRHLPPPERKRPEMHVRIDKPRHHDPVLKLDDPRRSVAQRREVLVGPGADGQNPAPADCHAPPPRPLLIKRHHEATGFHHVEHRL